MSGRKRHRRPAIPPVLKLDLSIAVLPPGYDGLGAMREKYGPEVMSAIAREAGRTNSRRYWSDLGSWFVKVEVIVEEQHGPQCAHEKREETDEQT